MTADSLHRNIRIDDHLCLLPDAAIVRSLPSLVRERGACCALPVVVDPPWATRRAALLRAVADPTRLSMLAALMAAQEPICICDFTAAFGLSQPTISHHVARLREAGLVEAERVGIWAHYRLADLDGPTRSVLAAVVQPA